MTQVILEVSPRRAFASAVDWPGWSRAGRDPDQALANLEAYRGRYGAVLTEAAVRSDPGPLEVVERVEGDASTDFGIPGRPAAFDLVPLEPGQAREWVAILEAAWEVLARVSGSAPEELRKGPRGGGRDTSAVVRHVVEAERGYASKLGIRPKEAPSSEERRRLVVERLAAGLTEPEPEGGWGRPWSPRYAARRFTWHVLDHAWEIEDRS